VLLKAPIEAALLGSSTGTVVGTSPGGPSEAGVGTLAAHGGAISGVDCFGVVRGAVGVQTPKATPNVSTTTNVSTTNVSTTTNVSSTTKVPAMSTSAKTTTDASHSDSCADGVWVSIVAAVCAPFRGLAPVVAAEG